MVRIVLIRIQNLPGAVIVLLFLVALISQDARAASTRTGWYWSLIYNNATTRIEPDSEDGGVLSYRFGKNVEKNFSLEGQIGIDNGSDSEAGTIILGGFARYEIAKEGYTLYGMLGVSAIEIYDDDADDISESSFSYGVGVDIFGDRDMAITLQYINHIEEELSNGQDLSYETIGIGLTYYFSKDRSLIRKSRSLRNPRY